MEQAAFEATVRRIESYARLHPARYRRRLLLLALLGYLVLTTALLFSLALAAVAIALGIWRPNPLVLIIVVPASLLSLSILRSLRVKVDPPAGRRLDAREAPQLFAAIDRVSRSLAAPPIDGVFIDGGFGASISQRRRWGLWGRRRRYLHFGIELLLVSRPANFLAILSHELAHISRQRPRSLAWIFQLHQSWEYISNTLDSHPGMLRLLLQRFIRYYSPYFGAYSLVLRRSREFSADGAAAALIGPERMAQALIDLEIKQRTVILPYWQNMLASQCDGATPPPRQPFAQLHGLAGQAIPANRTKDALAEALSLATGIDDSHPSLSQRLTALGCPDAEAADEGQFDQSAAECYLGGLLPRLLDELDRDWQQKGWPQGRELFRQSRQARSRLTELERRPSSRLDSAELRELAALAERYQGAAGALPYQRQLARLYSGDATAHFALGRLLLSLGDARGIAELDRSRRMDPMLIGPVSSLLIGFYGSRQRPDEAEPWRRLLATEQVRYQRAWQQLARVSRFDNFSSPSELADEQIEALQRIVKKHRQVKRAYLVRKHVNFHPNVPFFILGIKHSPFCYNWRQLLLDLADEAEPPETLVYMLRGDTHIESRMKEIPGARLL